MLVVPLFAMSPLVAGGDIAEVMVFLAAAVGLLAGLHVLGARRQRSWAAPSLGAAIVLETCCLGWCAVAPVSTLIVVGLAVGFTGALAALAAPGSRLRGSSAAASVLFLLAWVGAAGAAGGGSARAEGLAVTTVAGCALVALQIGAGRSRSLLAEAVAVAGLLVPDLWMLEQRSWFALACNLTVGVVAAGLAVVIAELTGTRPGRAVYRWAALSGAAPLTWSWLGAAHVRLIEAYTWPTAAIVVGLAASASRLARAGGRRWSSWATYGPGLVVALVPSTVLAVSHGGLARPLGVALFALGLVLAGARAQLRAPIVCGGATLVVLGLDAALPYLTEGPRWLTLGLAGCLLVWLGATLERRMATVRSLRSRYERLG